MLVTLNGVPSNKPFVHLVLDPELLERIDDFRFGFRLPSRNAAIRYLIEAGLDAEVTGSIPAPKAKRDKPDER